MSPEQSLKGCCQPRGDVPAGWLLWAFPLGAEAELRPWVEVGKGEPKESREKIPSEAQAALSQQPPKMPREALNRDSEM